VYREKCGCKKYPKEAFLCIEKMWCIKYTTFNKIP